MGGLLEHLIKIYGFLMRKRLFFLLLTPSVSSLKKKRKKDIDSLILEMFSGLLFGILGDLIVSQFIEVYNVFFSIETNLF